TADAAAAEDGTAARCSTSTGTGTGTNAADADGDGRHGGHGRRNAAGHEYRYGVACSARNARHDAWHTVVALHRTDGVGSAFTQALVALYAAFRRHSRCVAARAPSQPRPRPCCSCCS
ncbi:hypothetical protein PFISCL1PPCAC_21084, partial [Pristionchus fissidentatus]